MQAHAMRRYALALGICLICLLAAPIAQAKSVKAVVTASKIEVHAKAKASSKVLFTLKKGAEVTVLATSGKIAKISYKGKTGYVRVADLKKIETATPAPTGEKMTVQAKSAKVYARASAKSEVLGTVKKGESVLVVKTADGWAKVRRGGSVGYMQATAFAVQAPSAPQPTATAKPTVTPKPTRTAKPTATPKPTAEAEAGYKALKRGDKGAAVKRLQARLEALGFYDGAPSGSYLTLTVDAVTRFQGAAGLKRSGSANADTQAALYAQGAPGSDIWSASLKKGDSGGAVKRLQKRLKAKGYWRGTVDGRYDAGVAASVTTYQSVAGLTADGAAGPATLKSLFSSGAPAKPANVAVRTPAPEATPIAPQATATADATPAPVKTAAPTQAPASGGSAKKARAEKVISAAKAKLGKPYVFGSTGPNSYDCSGLTMYAYKQAGVSLPHSAYSVGYYSGKKISSIADLERGDVVCFNTMADGDLCDHVGVYLGGNQFIHASSGAGKVIISSLTGYYLSAFSWGRDVLS